MREGRRLEGERAVGEGEEVGEEGDGEEGGGGGVDGGVLALRSAEWYQELRVWDCVNLDEADIPVRLGVRP